MAGAVDFLEKPFDDERVLAAVRTALKIRASTANVPACEARSKSGWTAYRSANDRFWTILVAGLPNKTIAHDLGISPRTRQSLSRPCNERKCRLEVCPNLSVWRCSFNLLNTWQHQPLILIKARSRHIRPAIADDSRAATA